MDEKRTIVLNGVSADQVDAVVARFYREGARDVAKRIEPDGRFTLMVTFLPGDRAGLPTDPE